MLEGRKFQTTNNQKEGRLHLISTYQKEWEVHRGNYRKQKEARLSRVLFQSISTSNCKETNLCHCKHFVLLIILLYFKIE